MKKPISERAVYQRAKRVLAKRGELLKKASRKDLVEYYVINDQNVVVSKYNTLKEMSDDLAVVAEYEEIKISELKQAMSDARNIGDLKEVLCNSSNALQSGEISATECNELSREAMKLNELLATKLEELKS